MTKFTAGLVGLIVLLVFVWLGFTKFNIPFLSSPYTVHVVFQNANGLRPDSLVRIAGVNVGKVQDVSPVSDCKLADTSQAPCSAADVTMTIDDTGLPIHKDATFAIRPRIFLEGNFFIDVRPGSPSAPTAPDGYTFPIQSGTEPVQLDQVLTSLQADTRHNLQILLQQYGTAVKQAGPSFARSIRYWLPAYKYSAIVSHDALGIQPHDLSDFIDKGGVVAGALDEHPQNLQGLVTDFNRTAAAFARQNTALAQAVAELPHTLQAAIPAFNALNAAFPPLRRFAIALVPGVQSTGPMVDKSLPFITQLRLLVQPAELQGLASDLAVAIPALARLTVETIPFMKNAVRPASSCVVTIIYPWSQLTVPDSHFNASNGFPPHKVYIEGVDYLPGLAGESRNFDANGPYIRVTNTAGNLTYSLTYGAFGQSVEPLFSTQPALPPGGKRPPLAGGDVPNVPCETQPPITDLSSPTGPQLSPVP
jgi:phospholipid/cholesterol/gamma-HCH transport system substrate-binding protein